MAGMKVDAYDQTNSLNDKKKKNNLAYWHFPPDRRKYDAERQTWSLIDAEESHKPNRTKSYDFRAQSPWVSSLSMSALRGGAVNVRAPAFWTRHHPRPSQPAVPTARAAQSARAGAAEEDAALCAAANESAGGGGVAVDGGGGGRAEGAATTGEGPSRRC